MTNVTRQLWNVALTELIYYLVEHYNESCIDSNVTDDAFPATSAARTCQLMTSVDRQQAAIILGHVIITQCLGQYNLFIIEIRYLSLNPLPSGASTPYKRWSKCTMDKVGEAFLQKLRGGVH